MIDDSDFNIRKAAYLETIRGLGRRERGIGFVACLLGALLLIWGRVIAGAPAGPPERSMPEATTFGFQTCTRLAPTQGSSENTVRPSFVAQRNTVAPSDVGALVAAAAMAGSVASAAAESASEAKAGNLLTGSFVTGNFMRAS